MIGDVGFDAQAERDRLAAELHVEQVSQTVAAQLASFCLLSLRSQALNIGRLLKEAMDQAEGILKKWKGDEDYADPATPQESDDTDSPSRGTDKSFACDASPVTRKYTFRSRASCKDSVTLPERHDDDEHSGAEDIQ
ncbi:hypothetical protein ED733_000927 [Metarhizium rileyi]|uniref:Uncharacterized protein n=1 Tax=Metarhizium rileyi (strain RCEF 4871) TaxID=1649241 RepID=A0A5C6G7L6_METRR|nr:hypothetical protein ED733_000927 [Metarhizium rileyi]